MTTNSRKGYRDYNPPISRQLKMAKSIGESILALASLLIPAWLVLIIVGLAYKAL